MTRPVSIRLDDDVRETLEGEARRRRVGLSTLLRELATERARALRRARIRAQSEVVGALVARDPDKPSRCIIAVTKSTTSEIA